ncbi:MAG: ATP-binding cassette domain-containing protein [Bacteroidia bacterium]|nr:ATP-binding cassette domain-containing protein [Bacteroidia bacterium]
MASVVQIQSVSKSYADKVAVNQISIDIPEGIIFGLLGPNGAGKTTLIRMLTRITYPDSGSILFQGEILQEKHRQLVGYMPEERGLYRRDTLFNQLSYLLQLKGFSPLESKTRIDYWLERFQVEDWASKELGELSKGMQQKVQFIATVAHSPKLLILDEPFSGLDPLNSKIIEDILFELKSKGTTIIFSTHRMEQVEYLCDQVVLIHQGRILVNDTIKELKYRFWNQSYQLETLDVCDWLSTDSRLNVTVHTPNRLSFTLLENTTIKDILSEIIQKNTIISFSQQLPPLSDIFIKLVQN